MCLVVLCGFSLMCVCVVWLSDVLRYDCSYMLYIFDVFVCGCPVLLCL